MNGCDLSFPAARLNSINAFKQTFAQGWVQFVLHEFGTLARKTHAVDDSFILQKAENARGRIPRLGLGRDRSNFHVTKSQGGESANGDAILVISSRNADRIFEGQAKCLRQVWTGLYKSVASSQREARKFPARLKA